MMSEARMNWKTLKPGRELDRVIAERWDWRELKAHQYWHEDYDDQGTWIECWQGIPPEGTELPWGTHVLKVPDFSTDTNAALSLPLPDDFHRWVLSRDGNDYEATIEKYDDWADYGHERHLVVVETVTSTYGYADAMSRAWLTMRDNS